MHTLPMGRWAGNGYILFSNGWAAFACHTFHDSEKIGDVALLGHLMEFLCQPFHFCIGETDIMVGLSQETFRDF